MEARPDPVRNKIRLIAFCAIWCGMGAGLVPVRADEFTRQLQEELRRRYQYFGDINGRPSDELSAALRSYQKRKGLPISGMGDQMTANALGIQTGPERIAAGPPLPDGPILRSDAAPHISEADREFLRNLEDGIPPEIAPVEPESPAERPAVVESELPGIEDFIRAYLRAAQAETPDEELTHYADRLDYFDHGKVDRSFVAKDVRRYYQRWRERKFTLVRMRVTAQTATEATVEFRIRYDLKGNGESASGQTDNTFKVRRTESGLKLIQLKERRVRS